MKSRTLKILFVPLLAVASLVVAPTPASAHPAAGSWSDNHQLCTSSSSCVTRGNIVRFWQTILVEEETSQPMNCWWVDGVFGPNTAHYTEWYQRVYLKVAADGWVGPQTWSAVERRLTRLPAYDDVAQIHYYYKPVRVSYVAIRLYKESGTGYWWYLDKCGEVEDWRRLHH